MEIKLKYKYSCIGNSITNVDMVVKQCKFPYRRVRFNVLSVFNENLNTGEMLKYKELLYPKEENKNYVLGEKIKFKIINKNTGEVFYE